MNEQELVDGLKTREVRIYELVKGEWRLTRTTQMAFDEALDLKYMDVNRKIEISGPGAWVYMLKNKLAIKPLAIPDISEPSGNSSHLTPYRTVRNYNNFVLLVAAAEIEIEGITLPEGQEFYYPRVISRNAYRNRQEALAPRRRYAFPLSAYTSDGQYVVPPAPPLFFPMSEPYSTPR
jgi:hypothetical protein